MTDTRDVHCADCGASHWKCVAWHRDGDGPCCAGCSHALDDVERLEQWRFVEVLALEELLAGQGQP